MNSVKIICVFVSLVCFNVQLSLAQKIIAKGKEENKLFSVIANKSNNGLKVRLGTKIFPLLLAGYDFTDIHVQDIDGDGNDEIFFLDQSGVSVGGELRVLYWKSDVLKEVGEEYYANKMTIEKDDDKALLLLWQHDNEALFYCNEIVFFSKGKLFEYNSRKGWEEIIENYNRSVNHVKDKETKSRYYSYIALIYKKLGEESKSKEYFLKAKTLDTNNPFVE